MREAAIAAKLRHATIAQVVDFGSDGDDYYLALELVDGLDLRALLDAVPDGLPAELVQYIAIELATALDFAHRAGGAGWRRRRRAPRRLAVERADQQRGRGQAHRLRHRALARWAAAHAYRHRQRQGAVSRARVRAQRAVSMCAAICSRSACCCTSARAGSGRTTARPTSRRWNARRAASAAHSRRASRRCRQACARRSSDCSSPIRELRFQSAARLARGPARAAGAEPRAA